ncbi:hypothetical protein V2J09_010292 [Rumex salicifolius]
MAGIGNGEVEEKAGGGLEQRIQKTYFDVLGLCCSSEIALIERILTSIQGVKDVSVIVPSKTVIVMHDSALVSPFDIAKVLNQARLEANVRVNGKTSYQKKWPNPYLIFCGLLLGLSFLKYVYSPMKWLAVGSVAAGIWPILMRGFAAIKNLILDVNILVIIAVAGTLALRDFWEAGTIVFLFTIAEWLQTRASHKANAVMSSLMSIAPQKATIEETGELVNVEDVKLGTVLAVKTGEVIPIDGLVVEGSCEVDEKALTGEAFPVAKQKDSTVLAGTINLNGYISVKTTTLSEDCAVAKMAKLVEEAQNKKPRFQRLIDECAKYYTPVVVLLSAGLVIVPAAMRVHNVKEWLHLALVVLVSACPCGLILSTPVATFCALSKAASNGLLIKGGDYLEGLSKIKTVAFDKTGTITRGEFLMSGFRCLAEDISMDTLLYWVSSIESKSSHPIADAIVYYGKSQSVDPNPETVEDFQNFPGEGIVGRINDKEIYVGNRKLGQRAGCLAAPEIESSTEDGRTLGFVYSDGVVIGTFGLSDACRSGALDAIRDLKSMGIRTAMLTGDSNAAATHAHNQLENALDEVHAELLPEDKARILEEFKKSGPTVMVGDGVNDAPALATADVGISMGVSGSALATETGHVILMSNDIKKIPKVIRLAKRTQKKVIQNIVFSISTKAVVLAVAFAGHPIVWVAVLVDVLACLVVIFNSMTLLRGSHKHGAGKSNDAMHHNHAHGKKSTCGISSDSSLVHDHHAGSCQTSGAHKPSCSSNNVATRRFKAPKAPSMEEQATFCSSRKCNVDPLVHHHQHNVKQLPCLDDTCSIKDVECSSLGCDIRGDIDGCCQSVLVSKACPKEECKDLEGQVAGCLGDECPKELPSAEQSAKPALECDHQAECYGEIHEEPKLIDEYDHAHAHAHAHNHAHAHAHIHAHDHDHNHDHDHGVVHKHECVEMANREIGSCCKSFMEECCKMQGHRHTHVNFSGGFGGGLREIMSE